VAVDGDEGLHKARSSLYDLVLMTSSARHRWAHRDPDAQIRSQTAGMPVIALTANAMKGTKSCNRCRLRGYITKPIEVGTFVQQISGILEAKAS